MTNEQFITYYNGLTFDERVKLLNDYRDPYDGAEVIDITDDLGDFVMGLAELFKYEPERLAEYLNRIEDGAKCWYYCEGGLFNIWDIDDLTNATGDVEDIADYYAPMIDEPND